MRAPIRVVVADDSPTDRALIVAILRSDESFDVVGEARTGSEALELALHLRPDVITMDVQMPVMDGFQATEAIMQRAPTSIVVVSSTRPTDVDLSLAAAGAGALVVLEKPPSALSSRFEEARGRFLAMVKAMAEVKVVRRWTPRSMPAMSYHGVRRANTGTGVVPQVVAIAASTGGPAALRQVLRGLPRDVPASFLVVQHIAPGFVGGLVHWLAGECKVRVKVADHDERMHAGTVYIAPDGRHLMTASASIRLADTDPIEGFRPSASALFAGVARSHGARAAAVILTGMGRDGVDGLRVLSSAGGHVIAQDETTSIVYGMPHEAVRAGVVGAVLPLEEIGDYLIQLLTRTPS
ncbi:MAG TPA: chemotaxis-specific protein-glutamate methyltransferase CheB [Gemmatimonadaceae bacterium]|nr:chemotaxis-specific protein-glutamate methyltransferase CheB [Gemmatimonadaceae bacterium]